MNRVLTAVVAAAALWTAACSSGGSTITPPPPTGKYGPASLKGTYAFVTSGEVLVSGTSTPFARTGSFIADGNQHITGGVYDLVNSGGFSTTSSAPVPISGGNYTVNADGRGTLTLNVTSSGGPATINFAIVLTSTSGGLMIDETTSSQVSTGSGNFILQNTATFASGVSGSYVFDFTGEDGSMSPESLVGQFGASGGVITSGSEDANDAMSLNSSGTISGNFALDTANTAAGRGLATIEGQTYAFYIVDSTRVRFISINSAGVGPMLTGDAVAQSGGTPPPSPNGSFAFLVGGSTPNGGLTRVCRFNVSGGTVSKILMDVNNASSENEFGPSSLTNASLTYDSTTGRGVVSFQSSSVNVYSFVFYLSSPNSGVIQEVSPNDTTPAFDVADGSIAAQAAGPFSGSNITGPYAMNWSGLVTATGFGSTDEEDFLSQVTVSNLNLTGTGDIFQFTGPSISTNFGVGGSLNFNGGDGAGDNGKPVYMTVNLSGPHVDMVVYIVNPQLAFFANRDNNGTPRLVAGVLEAQQ
jgi:hypothetical protein